MARAPESRNGGRRRRRRLSSVKRGAQADGPDEKYGLSLGMGKIHVIILLYYRRGKRRTAGGGTDNGRGKKTDNSENGFSE